MTRRGEKFCSLPWPGRSGNIKERSGQGRGFGRNRRAYRNIPYIAAGTKERLRTDACRMGRGAFDPGQTAKPAVTAQRAQEAKPQAKRKAEQKISLRLRDWTQTFHSSPAICGVPFEKTKGAFAGGSLFSPPKQSIKKAPADFATSAFAGRPGMRKEIPNPSATAFRKYQRRSFVRSISTISRLPRATESKERRLPSRLKRACRSHRISPLEGRGE